MNEALEHDGLRAFAVFARHLNLTAAAAELHIAQPSLHTKLRKLGQALGQELYEREGRGLRLTPAGQKLARFATENTRRVQDFVADLGGRPASVTIAAGHGAFRWVIGPGVRRIVSSGRTLHVRTQNREGTLADVRAGRADVGVFGSDPPPPGFASREIARYPQVLMIVTDPVPESVTVADLAGHSLLLPPPERPHRRRLDRALLDAGVSVSVAAEVDGWDLMTHFVSLGLGAAVVNGCVEPPPGVVAVPVRDLPEVPYWAVWRPERVDLAEEVVPGLAGG
ncbi:LysR family transcriptional regulator [Kineosporia succinea]|uniref:DNA-binding transcriptional LysR family regulator n=1 Tax=Kineosporia succinea TaxID=84632 RepID=A0ABT9P8Z0_9ACTN|nr:LysR family transcriptional regulator [Kineosporia succinea]MDP9829159.1 DNA-binding transcriptional LysR family regulator [Kineosporia succinea]